MLNDLLRVLAGKTCILFYPTLFVTPLPFIFMRYVFLAGTQPLIVLRLFVIRQFAEACSHFLIYHRVWTMRAVLLC